MNQQFAEALLKLADKHPDQVAEAIAGPFIALSKMEAATRQLNVAVWLWFKGADCASVHTLTGAAFGILADLFFHKTKTRPTPFDDPVDEDLRGFTKELRNMMKDTEDFLKHARHDPDDTHQLNPIWTEHYIFNAIKAYAGLNDGDIGQPLMSLFVIRFRIFHPDLFVSGGSPGFNERWNIESVKSLSRIAFFDRFGGPLVVPFPPSGN